MNLFTENLVFGHLCSTKLGLREEKGFLASGQIGKNSESRDGEEHVDEFTATFAL